MPRQPRLDAPETLHHVMVRGLERRAIFRDDADRADFVTRMACNVGRRLWKNLLEIPTQPFSRRRNPKGPAWEER
jgi:hypothetical protein